MDLKDPMDTRILRVLGPTRFEYDPNNVLTRIAIEELRNGVLDSLVLFEKVGFLENLTVDKFGSDALRDLSLPNAPESSFLSLPPAV